MLISSPLQQEPAFTAGAWSFSFPASSFLHKDNEIKPLQFHRTLNFIVYFTTAVSFDPHNSGETQKTDFI